MKLGLEWKRWHQQWAKRSSENDIQETGCNGDYEASPVKEFPYTQSPSLTKIYAEYLKLKTVAFKHVISIIIFLVTDLKFFDYRNTVKNV